MPMRSRPAHRLLALATAGALLFVAACGSDDDAQADQTQASGTTAQSTGSEPVATDPGTTSAASSAPSTEPTSSEPVTLRLGYFPNVTHAPALVGIKDGLFA